MTIPSFARGAALALVAALAASAALAGDPQSASARPALERADPKYVCMINNKVFDQEQIPVQVEGKTYYGCCQMCKQALAEKAELRAAADPLTGNKVDKAKAVIGSFANGSVLYFESEKTFEEYRKKLER